MARTNPILINEVLETERHIHNYERWFGPAASPSGEDHVADILGEVGGSPSGVQAAFRLTSGANKTWGTALQIWGPSDAALVLPTGMQAFVDIHEMLPADAEGNLRTWLLRLIDGASAAAGITAGDCSVFPLFTENIDKARTHMEILRDRQPESQKVWAQLLLTTSAAAEWLELQFGAHGYPADETLAITNFPFFMVLASDGVPEATGLTVTATRSLDGGAFAACANSGTISEVSNGIYTIDLDDTDRDGDTITLMFQAAGALTRIITFITN